MAKYEQLTESEREWLRQEIDQQGERAVAKKLGMAPQTIYRSMAGGRVQRSTARLLRILAGDQVAPTVGVTPAIEV